METALTVSTLKKIIEHEPPNAPIIVQFAGHPTLNAVRAEKITLKYQDGHMVFAVAIVVDENVNK